jgi:midasin
LRCSLDTRSFSTFAFQTDASDLLGNWKPVDVRVLVRPVVAEFETLFEATLNCAANAQFLTHLRLRLDQGKYSECIKIMNKG